ncbi:MAG: hypothetical protein M1816_000064 [Peltula sp. TS41687]|nr:MAG: hypothetical protein M1816_000064 [Peltula sp. TS41687]
MSYTGSRPEALVEPRYHAGLNNGLLYRDVEVTVMRTDSGLRFNLIIKFRNRKNRRQNEKEADKFVLHETLLDRSTCPVSYFLTIAIADDVFENISQASCLNKIQEPKHLYTTLKNRQGQSACVRSQPMPSPTRDAFLASSYCYCRKEG